MPPKPRSAPFAADPAVLSFGPSARQREWDAGEAGSALEEWDLDDELLARMEAREDAELGCDAWNEDTFGDLMEEWQVGDEGESCVWRDASPARGGVEEEVQDEETRGRCRDSRICRCALDALRPRRVRVAVDVVVNGCECEVDASAGAGVCADAGAGAGAAAVADAGTGADAGAELEYGRGWYKSRVSLVAQMRRSMWSFCPRGFKDLKKESRRERLCRSIVAMERFVCGLGIELDVEAFVKCCRGNMDLSEDGASVPSLDVQQMGEEDEEDGAEYVEYTEAPEFYVVDAECYYGEVNMEAATDGANPWASPAERELPVSTEPLQGRVSDYLLGANPKAQTPTFGPTSTASEG